MYQGFYGLSQPPFSIAPNPAFLYLTTRHREALAHLTYGLGESGGFVLLTGEVGTGKTTVSRGLLAQLPPKTDVAFILNPALTESELLATLCDELNIAYPPQPSLKQLTDCISEFLTQNHQEGRRTLMVIDEAQHLRPEVLEQLRLLTNLETDTRKLLQVILIGQPELQELLKRKELRQLAQRITARYHLLPLIPNEVSDYIQHRLHVAGRSQPLFKRSAMAALHKYSNGVPRVINLLAERALLGCYGAQKPMIDAMDIIAAAEEVLDIKIKNRTWGKVAAGSVLALALGAGSMWAWLPEPEQPTPPPPVDISQWQLRYGQELMAFQALFHRWRLPTPAEDPCHFAQWLGLRCEQRRGELSQVLNLSRPAVIQLTDPENGDYFAALLAEKRDYYLLALQEKQVWVSHQWLTEHYEGTYKFLLLPSTIFPQKIDANSSVAHIQWLEARLALVNGRSARYLPTYDRLLDQDLRNFQHEQGLVVDGVAGSNTLERLDQLAKLSQPHLQEFK